MDIEFTFIYNPENNSFLFRKPNKKSKKYVKAILDSLQKKSQYYHTSTSTGQRIEIEFGEKWKIYMFKNELYFFLK